MVSHKNIIVMSPRTDAQFEEIRENKRAIILEAALELFSTHGYHATSISLITKKAKISKGLLYNYFESKESLLEKIIIEGFEELIHFFDKNKDGVLTDEEFEYFIRESFSLIKSNVHFWKLYFSLLIQPVVIDILNKKMLEFFEPFFAIFTNFFARKGIKDPLTEVRFFAALIDGVGMHYIVDPENFPLEKSIDKIIHMYLKK